MAGGNFLWLAAASIPPEEVKRLAAFFSNTPSRTARTCPGGGDVLKLIVATDTEQRKMPGLLSSLASPLAFLMNLDRLRREFPDYDIATLPTLPEGYVDASSYIDAAPSFENEERGLKVYVDYAEYADRESGRSQRFCVSRYDEEAGDYEDVALSTNDWAEVIRFLTA